MPSKDIQNVGGVEFGDWKLIPLDNLNWELAHRHATTDNHRARKSGTVGKVQWHRLGKYYSWSTIGSALLYAADAEVKAGCEESAMTLTEAAEKWEATLRDFRECVSRIVQQG
jgi:hypothetical protein